MKRVSVVFLAVGLAVAFKLESNVVDMSWQTDYAHWRSTDTQPASQWFADLPLPQETSPPLAVFNISTDDERQSMFFKCLDKESAEFVKRNEVYKSPDSVQSVRELARAALDATGRTVTIGIFYGRERYVKILWKYLERNLVANGGIVDKIVVVSRSRNQDEEGTKAAAQRVARIIHKYPNHVSLVEMCGRPYGCAFDEIFTDNNTVYVKMDDDIIFIKDGSIEHLVLQVLKNPNYAFYSGSIVNNPHSVALHKMVGAYPPVTYHWSSLGRADRPFVDANETGRLYYGSNMYDAAGSQAHESFIYNVGRGRLDLYNFDLWNMNACRCGKPQERLNLCKNGFYRWAVNVFAYLREPTLRLGYKMPAFDEPVISVGWTRVIPPHRVAIVGESLFVHYEFTPQRQSKPDWGLREDVLLPWYHEFAKQYVSRPYGEVWPGNITLQYWYEERAARAGEVRFSSHVRTVDPGIDP